ncbi:AMIN domain-containing protein [Thauera chlorobenzoica]|uniref:AMIN domain-containing protein n=1 Tax=Thauera chlorobenzoica TaxID=96773 RepID=UPI0008A04643|nr:AMIN domain-containing protein [Thauera chlorobenzoica]SEF64743.1 AMIN domain-containing protein [Thauera chlorobenzoica]
MGWARRLFPIFASTFLVAAYAGTARLQPPSGETQAPAIEIRHTEVRQDKISPQSRLLIATNLDRRLGDDRFAQLARTLSEQLKKFGVESALVPLDMAGAAGQSALRSEAEKLGSPYLLTMIGGPDFVLQGHGPLSQHQVIANLFEFSTARPLWASLLQYTRRGEKLPQDEQAAALMTTLVGELQKIGLFADQAQSGMPAVIASSRPATPAAPPPLAPTLHEPARPAQQETAGVNQTITLPVRRSNANAVAEPLRLHIRSIGEIAEILLEAGAPLPVRHMVLKAPDRLVLDLEGIELERSARPYETRAAPDHPLVERVRAGQNRPRVLRIVLELKHPVTARPRTLPAAFPRTALVAIELGLSATPAE